MATIKSHEGHKTAPILTSGNVFPAIITQFLEYLDPYLHKAKIIDSDKVRNMLTSFQDIHIDNWVKNNHDRYVFQAYEHIMQNIPRSTLGNNDLQECCK